VVGNLQIWFALFGIGMGIAALGCMITYWAEEWQEGPSYAKRWAWSAVPLIIMSALLPSSSAMYAIAASQIGEQLANSDDVKGIAADAKKALQQWIKKQVEPQTK